MSYDDYISNANKLRELHLALCLASFPCRLFLLPGLASLIPMQVIPASRSCNKMEGGLGALDYTSDVKGRLDFICVAL